MAVAPGIDWHSATPSVNFSPDTHPRRIASSRMYATMAGPPNAVAPSLRKERNSSAGLGDFSLMERAHGRLSSWRGASEASTLISPPTSPAS
jgi:hypothetical protein